MRLVGFTIAPLRIVERLRVLYHNIESPGALEQVVVERNLKLGGADAAIGDGLAVEINPRTPHEIEAPKRERRGRTGFGDHDRRKHLYCGLWRSHGIGSLRIAAFAARHLPDGGLLER